MKAVYVGRRFEFGRVSLTVCGTDAIMSNVINLIILICRRIICYG